VKKADLIASWFAVFLGFSSILLGIMTDVSMWAVIALVVVYFQGSGYVFLHFLSTEDQLRLESIEIIYGTKFWTQLVVGAIISIVISAFYFVKFEPGFISAILVGLGLMSALTAFVTPEHKEKTHHEKSEEFG